MRDSSIAVTLPDLNISLSRLFPFKRKKAAGEERWYEKISLSYTGPVSYTHLFHILFSNKADIFAHFLSCAKSGLTRLDVYKRQGCRNKMKQKAMI